MSNYLLALIGLLSTAVLTGCSDHGSQDAGKPNIILITIDDLGWTDLGCYGSTYYETPNLDRLASEGIRFTSAYASAAVCSPTRAALMTGKAPARTGITDWIRARFQGGDIPEDGIYRQEFVGNPQNPLLCPTNPLWLELEEVTIAEALKEVGYTTAHIGKWHLGPDDWYPEHQGFDINIGGCDYGEPPSYFDPYTNNRMQGIPNLPARREGEYLTDRLADEAARFIFDHQDKPFFLNMADYAVHTPIQGKPELVEKYRNKPATNHDNPTYAAMVESMDQLVGRIVHTVDSLGLGENTLIVFSSDNGGTLIATDNAPLRSGKGFPYEGGLRVPLIVRHTGQIPAGKTSDIPVISHDWFPTLCAIAGASPGNQAVLDGVNLKDVLLHGKETLSRDRLHWHYPHYRDNMEVPYSVIRQENWKLIKRYQGVRYELFDLDTDPWETQNLAEAFPERVRQLEASLAQWLGAVGAALPKPNPNYTGE